MNETELQRLLREFEPAIPPVDTESIIALLTKSGTPPAKMPTTP